MKCIDSHVFFLESGRYPFMSNSIEKISELYQNIEGIVLMCSVKENEDSIKRNKLFFKKLDNIKNNFRNMFEIYPFVFLHPIDRLSIQNFCNENNVMGIKVHPSISQVCIDDERFVPLLSFSDDNNFPILIHCGRGEKSRFSHIMNVIYKYNNPFIIAHLGGLATELILKTMDFLFINKVFIKRSNLFFDTSGIYNPRVLRRVLEIVPFDKLIYGSDEPFHHHETQKEILKNTMLNFGYTKKEIECVFYHNIRSILFK